MTTVPSRDLFYGTSGPRDALIACVGEAYGREEDLERRPFVGESGRELDKMLAEAGIVSRECFKTNLVLARPQNNAMWQWLQPNVEARKAKAERFRDLHPLAPIRDGFTILRRQLALVRPRVILGFGNWPLWALTVHASTESKTPKEHNPLHHTFRLPAGIGAWRGSQTVTEELDGTDPIPYLPVYHPAAILRSWEWRAITVHDLRRAQYALRGAWKCPTRHYFAPPTLRETFRALDAVDQRLSAGPVDVAADIETGRHSVITCFGLAHTPDTAISIPFVRPTPAGLRPFWAFDEERAIVRRLRRIFLHPNCTTIGQNFLYDVQYLSRWWRLVPPLVRDTMLAQHSLFPGTPKDLAYLASLYCPYYCFWKDDAKDWDEKLDLDALLFYNCDDAVNTLQIWSAQKPVIERMNRQFQFDFLMRSFWYAFRMMERGIRVDLAVRGTFYPERTGMLGECVTGIEARETWLDTIVPAWLRPEVSRTAKQWHASAQQQMRLFYDHLGLKSVHHRKTGNVTIDDTALHEIKLRYPELTRLTDAIGELRSLRNFRDNSLSALIDPDGRMRCSFNPGGPETFRFSSSANAFGRGMNLQNLSKGGLVK